MPRARRASQSDLASGASVRSPKFRAEERLAALAWGLAHPVRVRILQLLVRRETCLCGEIVDEMPVAQSTVSQHLKILKEVGLVQGEIDGPRVCYCVNREVLAELKEKVGQL